ncbi:MAG: hypothetical protein AAFT19_01690 [Pseudomonadota bacterium]
MRDHESPDAEGDRILLAQVEQAFWLLEGEAYLNAMLSGQGPHPKPVQCLRFPSAAAMEDFLSDGPDATSLWRIHPAIVARLERHGELVTFSPSETD